MIGRTINNGQLKSQLEKTEPSEWKVVPIVEQAQQQSEQPAESINQNDRMIWRSYAHAAQEQSPDAAANKASSYPSWSAQELSAQVRAKMAFDDGKLLWNTRE